MGYSLTHFLKCLALSNLLNFYANIWKIKKREKSNDKFKTTILRWKIMDSGAIISVTLGVISAVLFGMFQLQVRFFQEKMSWYFSIFGRICKVASMFFWSNFEYSFLLKCFAFIGFGSSETIEDCKLKLPIILVSSLGVGLVSGIIVYIVVGILSLMSIFNWIYGIGFFIMILGWRQK